jgi:hypothetical protein
VNALAREVGMRAIGAAGPLLAKPAVAHGHGLWLAGCGDSSLTAGTRASVHGHRRLPRLRNPVETDLIPPALQRSDLAEAAGETSALEVPIRQS